jgi:hypothetical protein
MPLRRHLLRVRPASRGEKGAQRGALSASSVNSLIDDSNILHASMDFREISSRVNRHSCNLFLRIAGSLRRNRSQETQCGCSR